MKAKPTLYDGIRFRSRLEARWAVFMDALMGPNIGRIWVYEPQVAGVTGYLPDFGLGHTYVEVKPASWLEGIPRGDIHKWTQFVEAVKKPLWVFIGEPGGWVNGKLVSTTKVLILVPTPDARVAMGQWGECNTCGIVKVVEDGQAVCSECVPVGRQITRALHVVRDASYVDAT